MRGVVENDDAALALQAAGEADAAGINPDNKVYRGLALTQSVEP